MGVRDDLQTELEDFRALVQQPEQQSSFDGARLEDVWKETRDLEVRLANEQRARNFRKIQPLFDILKQYHEAATVLCVDRTAVRWSWAPIQVYLAIASDYPEALDALLDLYADIATQMPRFGAWRYVDHPVEHFQKLYELTTLVCCDLLQLQHRIYLLFTRNEWRKLFVAAWKRALPYFRTVSSSLERHAQIMERYQQQNTEALPAVRPAHDADGLHAQKWGNDYNNVTATGSARQHNGNHYGDINNSTVYHQPKNLHGQEIVSELSQLRAHLYHSTKLEEKERTDAVLAKILEWLDPDDQGNEDDFQRLSELHHEGSSDWFLDHDTIKSWTMKSSPISNVWVYGNPGCGKSILSVQLIRHLQTSEHAAIAFHLCNFRIEARNNCMAIARNIAGQLIRKHPDLLTYVFETYVVPQRTPSMLCLKEVVKTLLNVSDDARLIIDGLDECQHEEQTKVLDYVLYLAKTSKCKVMVFSQNGGPIQRRFQKGRTNISLSQQRVAIDASITSFVKHKLAAFAEDEESIFAGESDLLDELEHRIVNKAEGMFLWVRLVLAMVELATNKRELYRLVECLPNDIQQAYARIIVQIQDRQSPYSSVRYLDILRWLASSERPLHVHELLAALAYSVEPFVLNDETKLARRILDCAKPLIEVMPTGLVSFVHSTVKSYVFTTQPPLLSAHLSQRDITMACGRALFDGLALLESVPDAPAEQTIIMVVSGYFDLHSYAAGFWLYHLKQYTSLVDESVDHPNANVKNTLTAMGQRYSHYLHLTNIDTSSLANSSAFMAKVPTICCSAEFLRMVASEEHGLQQNLGLRLDDEPDDEQDVTLLQRSSKCLAHIVESLMDPAALDRYPFLDARALQAFRDLRSLTAYTCRFTGCLRSSSGFSDQNLRDDHERKAHGRRLWCAEPFCAYASTIGFSSEKARKSHWRRHHANVSAQLPRYRLSQPLEILSDTESSRTFRRASPSVRSVHRASERSTGSESYDPYAQSRQAYPPIVSGIPPSEFPAREPHTYLLPGFGAPRTPLPGFQHIQQPRSDSYSNSSQAPLTPETLMKELFPDLPSKHIQQPRSDSYSNSSQAPLTPETLMKELFPDLPSNLSGGFDQTASLDPSVLSFDSHGLLRPGTDFTNNSSSVDPIISTRQPIQDNSSDNSFPTFDLSSVDFDQSVSLGPSALSFDSHGLLRPGTD